LRDLPPFFTIHRFEKIGSSNDEVRRLAESGAPEGTLVWAGEQTAGRGRRGRNWVSPPGNLYLSLLLRPGVDYATAPQLGFVCALAMGEAVASFLPDAAARVRYKWPNDLLVDGAKIAGILLEAGPVTARTTTASADPGPRYVIAGIGVNIVSAPIDTPYPALALADAGATGAHPPTLLTRFAEHFEAGYAVWREEGFARMRGAWLAASHCVGDEMVVRIGEGQEIHGRFLDLDADGALLLELASGERRRIGAGEVQMMAA
jgi:BirA family transcriptional regulator, biotin operon repressor / biotin---[acetyl-CoA-carboxylase] ligase